MVCAEEPGDEDSESDASSFPMSEEEEKKATAKQAEPKKGQRGRKRRTEPIVVTKEDGTREEVSPQVYRRLRRCAKPSSTKLHCLHVRLALMHAAYLAQSVWSHMLHWKGTDIGSLSLLPISHVE